MMGVMDGCHQTCVAWREAHHPIAPDAKVLRTSRTAQTGGVQSLDFALVAVRTLPRLHRQRQRSHKQIVNQILVCICRIYYIYIYIYGSLNLQVID